MNSGQIITEITRDPTNLLPSALVIYDRHFGQPINFVYHTGITDRYGSYPEEDEEDDEDIWADLETLKKRSDDLTSNGVQYLEKELLACIEYTTTKWSSDHRYKTPIVYKYINHEQNCFIATLVFVHINTLVQIRVSPCRRRTLTAFTIASCHHDVSNKSTHEEHALHDLVAYAQQFIAPEPTKKDKIHIITQSGSDFYLKDIPLTKTKHKTEFSYDHYNEDFEEISTRLLTSLQNDNESGLVLFHGDPGTGKTSYLKYLLHTISNKKLIYMPPDLTEHLSSPGFITFMMSEAMNSILLIEDAETVLRAREAGGNQAVSNILNISDGILGDVLKLQIVCTFNSRLEEIDSALRRPGRCIAEYRFEKLSESRASNLMVKLHGEDVIFEPKEMTLAEVFNFKKPRDVTKEKERVFGFIPNDNK